jgi:hypothetical protein
MGTVLALGLLYAISVAFRKEGTQGLPPSSTVAGHLFLIGFAAGFPEAVSRYRSKNWPDKLCRESLICAAVCFAVGATATSLLRPVVFGRVADDPVARFVVGGLIPLALYFAGPIFGGDNARRGESKS